MNKAYAILISALIISISIGSFIETETREHDEEINFIKNAIPFYDEWIEYAKTHDVSNWTYEDWLDWYKYEGNPHWGSTNLTDTSIATDWLLLSNIGNLTWGANYDVQAKFNTTSGMLDWTGVMNNLSINNIQATASYIIWKDGSTYYAMNGTTELIEFQSTNASWVIQSAIDNSPFGSKILIKAGRYTIPYPIIPKEGIWISGEGINATILYLDDNVNDSMFKDTSSFTDNKFWFKLSDMGLDGNKANNAYGCGIELVPTGTGKYWDVELTSLFIRNFAEHGIYTNDCHGWYIENVASEYNDGQGIRITAGEYGVVIGCTVLQNGGAGINTAGTSRVRIIGNQISSNGGAGIVAGNYAYIAGNNIMQNTNREIYCVAYDNIRIIGNFIYGSGSGTGIDLDAGATNNIIIGNHLSGHTNEIINDGSNNIIKNNIGYTTENSGSYEITGDDTTTSWSISHGLATTPSIVLVTPTNQSMANATWWVSAKSSTTFTITFSSAPSSGTKLSFDWYAEV